MSALLVVGLAGWVASCARDSVAPPPNVLLVTFDTLRADWVHAYGFAGENTPSLDALAARGVLFENAIAAASLTAPAHASIMTGRYARQHSVGTLNGESRLEGLETLAEQFREAGYDTAAFVSNVVLRRRIGLDRGFDVYDDDLMAGEENRPAYFERPAQLTVERALGWLAGRSPDRPFFLWLHLQDPHGPYTPPAEFEGRVGDVSLRLKADLPVLSKNSGQAGIPSYQALSELRDPAVYAGRYAEEIMYADFWLGRLVGRFEARSTSRGAIILMTADHGESMGEQGFFFQHGQSIRPEMARVPLIVVAPGVSPKRTSALASHVDIVPTLLDLARLPSLPGASGISLVSSFGEGDGPSDRFVFSDTEGEAGLYGPGRLTRLIGTPLSNRSGRVPGPLRSETLVQNADGAWRPGSLDESAVERLSEYVSRAAEQVPVGVMEPEHIEQLRALGYLDPDDHEAGAPAAPESPAQTP
ncbi:MAG: sulfatase [Myxococcota bacterium]